MEYQLEPGNSYTDEYILEFLSQNFNKNFFLVSEIGITLLTLQQGKKYIITDIKSVCLHSMKTNDPFTYIQNDDVTLYYIKREG